MKDILICGLSVDLTFIRERFIQEGDIKPYKALQIAKNLLMSKVQTADLNLNRSQVLVGATRVESRQHSGCQNIKVVHHLVVQLVKDLHQVIVSILGISRPSLISVRNFIEINVWLETLNVTFVIKLVTMKYAVLLNMVISVRDPSIICQCVSKIPRMVLEKNLYVFVNGVNISGNTFLCDPILQKQWTVVQSPECRSTLSI